MDLNICLKLFDIDKIYQVNQKLTPEHWSLFYWVVTKEHLLLYITPWKIIQALNPRLMKTCILIYFSSYLFIHFGSRLEQKSSLMKHM